EIAPDYGIENTTRDCPPNEDPPRGWNIKAAKGQGVAAEGTREKVDGHVINRCPRKRRGSE
ncbi:MAG: hypothetical protein QME89_07205, partial [Actinomycetota bacterium]|nr:hypothetical protein [Actinomycetota bacterium]